MGPEALLEAPARPGSRGSRRAGRTLGTLRVLDFGAVSPVRSQSLWHALACGVGRGSPAALALCRPAQPYVSLGYHRPLTDLDLETCRRRGLPVLRRLVGGGTVYLDSRQLFFQVVVPPEAVPAARSQAVAELLGPARAAFEAAGLPADFDQGELAVAGRKVCGHGAGLVGGAVVVVGNLLERFDAVAAAGVLWAPDVESRRRLAGRMAECVGPDPTWPVDAQAFGEGLVSAYAEAFGVTPEPGGLTPFEERVVRRFDRMLGSPAFLRGPGGQSETQLTERRRAEIWTVKVRAGVVEARVVLDSTVLRAALVGGRLRDVVVEDPEGDQDPGVAMALEGATEGSPALEALARGGPSAARAAEAAARLLARARGGGE
ncbi:biotin/lipoate A/B protein ligase family protein [Aciditerrimonas ferrireducens]|jgi:lipoate-protein ligase A|uniref:Biotin/lipoate A/B protein ligase family protein n=1 Tax=Aciditerrimonas ferrireducens TaxID=667306 RepID=A0ABV6C1P1_9ACTN